MTAVKAGDVDRAVLRRAASIVCLLFYGPDAGRVSERARAAASTAVDDADDAFQLVRLEGDAVADTPGRLAEEASTYGLFGGRRAIWVRPTSRNIAPAVAATLPAIADGTLLVLEGGELGKAAPLRVLCEASPIALALPCYADDTRDLATLVVETLRADGLEIERAAREVLLEALGGDRLATRSELTKLALYGRGKGTLTVEDVEAVVSDVSTLGFDGVVDAAFGGSAAELDAELIQQWSGGVSPAALVAASLRHALALLERATQHADGVPVDRLVKTWRGLHFRRQAAVARQIPLWSPVRAARAVGLLQVASLETRRWPGLAQPITSEVLFRLGALARGASGRPKASA